MNGELLISAVFPIFHIISMINNMINNMILLVVYRLLQVLYKEHDKGENFN